MILADTNILLRIAQPGHPHRQPALEAIELLRVRDKEEFAIAPQVLYEMHVVCTRPAGENGFGMTPERARVELAAAQSLFQVLAETSQVFPSWETLIGKYAIRGKRAHDARLVAAMIVHRIPKLLTFNDGNFRFAEVTALNPFDVLGVPRI